MNMRKKVDWPESEPIPQTMKEALALGWEIEGYETGEERTFTGTVDIRKTVGLCDLWLKVPFRAKYTYQAPHTPHVSVTLDVFLDQSAKSRVR